MQRSCRACSSISSACWLDRQSMMQMAWSRGLRICRTSRRRRSPNCTTSRFAESEMNQFASSAGPSDVAILAYQVRECTLRLFDATEPGSLTWTPQGTVNHILWHAGHAVWVADVLTTEPVTGQSD